MTAAGNYIVESDVDNWPDAVSQTATFATTDVNIANEQLTIGIDVATGSRICFTSTGALPAPLVDGTAYYAIRIGATIVQVALNPVHAAAGTAVNLTDVGTGTHTIDVGEGSSTADRQEVIDRAEQKIENLTGDFFYAKSFIEYFNGNGKDRLFLGFIPDILSVTEIKVFGVILETSWWTFDKNSIFLDPEAAAGSGGLPELHLLFKYEAILFPRGMANIKITGTYGWASCPVAIKKAAIILCKAENDPTLYSQHEDFASEKLGDYAYTLGNKKFLTGISQVDTLLKEYIPNKPTMGVV